MTSKNEKYYDYYLKGKDFNLKNNFDSAIEYYNKSLTFKKNNISCLTELADLYEKLNRFDESIKCNEQILSFENNITNKMILLNKIGMMYSNNIYDLSKAVEYFEKIVKIKNDIPEVFNNIACCYLKLRNFKLCETNYYNSLRIQKDNTTICCLGDLYFYSKKYDLSIKFYEKVDDFKTNIIIKYNCSFPYLAQKKFIEGFNLYENRLLDNSLCLQTRLPKRAEIPHIENWDGEKICNNLLVIYEQGIGDNIQYYRYIIELSKKYPNMRIDYFCKEIVQHIFKEYNNIHIIDKVIISNYDYKIYMMSLPYILKINNVVPNTINYMNVNAEKVEYWKNELSHLKKYKVGITYNGLLASIIDKNIQLDEFSILFDSNIDLLCIHKSNEIDDKYKIMFKDNITFLDIDKDVPFEDTIAILHNIDLLITIDTSIVHIAGVLNIKAWLLLGYVSDWRWFDDENICHWYNSVELVRMKENKELKYILPYVKEKLDKTVQQQFTVIS